ncbi:prolyl aminopeptidase [Kineococcus sp. SYSU DK018]|uniref:prolyl aminopeptidase n=1 Tax=Kineococcus sp. SYSU DK018 TaxID=3383139 RepID=UPI003D7EA03D
MAGYPAGEPYERGLLDVGDGHRVSWTVSGNPAGKPVVVVHGGPGGRATPHWRSYLDPARYRVVQFDQRGCGLSTPSASEDVVDLSANTTAHLVADVEQLREHLGVQRWMVLGASWGSTLGLAYAQVHPQRVSEVVLFAVATTTRREIEWITRDMGRVFPREWEAFRDAVPAAEREGNLPAAYSRLLRSPDPEVRQRAAAAWCAWEDVHVSLAPGHRPDPRYADPAFRLAFARLVTHYWAHDGFLADLLPDGSLLAGAHRLAGVPAVLVHGRLDVSSPLDTAWQLHRAWPGSRLVVLEGDGHGGAGFTEHVVAATDRFARTPG